ncbi:MAG: phosphoenolpyruvate carboxylase [Actinobacteria bacterium]|nr:phosphoenolpyruvate carboxylase [Actinomycetota bacterium]
MRTDDVARYAEREFDMPASLRRDVRILGDALGQTIAEAGGSDLFRAVEALRASTMAFRQAPSTATLDGIHAQIEGMDLGRADAVARAFTCYFQLINLAEERQRMRTLRDRGVQREAITDSLAAAVNDVVARDGREALLNLLDRLRVQPVFTAHPTEARRRAVTEALHRIGEQLDRFDEPHLPRTGAADIHRRLREEIAILWRTAQIRDRRPTPLDEVRRTLAVFDESLFLVVPRIYRELDRALGPETVGARPPAFPAFLRWGSWVGGDRDGNPYVTAEVTRATLAIHTEHVLRGLERATRRIGRMLTATSGSTPPSQSLRRALRRDAIRWPDRWEEITRSAADQPHRMRMLAMADRLAATRTGTSGGYALAAEFVEDLAMLQESLEHGGAARLAYGEVQHLRWQAETFGFHFASLEIRQDSATHGRVIAELAPWAERDLDALDRLATEGWPADITPTSELAQEVIATLRTVAELQRTYGVDACRRYAVSWSREASDVMTVRALARLAVPDGSLTLDVVPLFESREDLRRAPKELDRLLALPSEQARLDAAGRRVEVMLGYSDSTKDAGFLAANIALFEAQAALTEWADRNDVALTLFHGRGGAVGRGGGPANRAILGQAPGSVDGRFKITEQGEVVFSRYRTVALAQRHLGQITNATLRASLHAHDQPDPADLNWELIRTMARASEAAYRELVGTHGFAEFFAAVTPSDELGGLQLGSRPTRRGGAGGGLDALRAIPWSFAWAQARINLPGWYGLGTGLAAGRALAGGIQPLRDLMARWPFLRTAIDNAALSMVKADMLIARGYLDMADRPELTDRITDEYARTEELVRQLLGQRRLLEDRPVLRRAVDLRNPYVDALSFLQQRALRGARADGTDAPRWARLVQLTVNGVSAGLQNTG